jgi:hypothetical protein
MTDAEDPGDQFRNPWVDLDFMKCDFFKQQFFFQYLADLTFTDPTLFQNKFQHGYLSLGLELIQFLDLLIVEVPMLVQQGG